MSNAKWCKLFEAVSHYETAIGGVRWKFSWSDESFVHSLEVLANLIGGRHFGDGGPAAFAELKDIEWIAIPAQYPDKGSSAKRPLPERYNNIAAIVDYLAKVAQFPIVASEEGIKIMGYGP
ncbi:hypothetical protein [Gallaecimonas mangrovi]|uniref:hypothetical protein n=1 Tax=Gallaecimonas mangrovi TaxID=2291597 RepID=UPI000E20BD92|nr:hypothetical protein [Gallaecimonas mangrovi]